ncbi:MAG: c-type cytochrome [Alphaproteobacteria bacterium]|nr:c-type cytochrome [Alphaproteobacteria bacterium]
MSTQRIAPDMGRTALINGFPPRGGIAALAACFIAILCLAPAHASPRWVPLPIMKSKALSGLTYPGDASRGKAIYTKCMACHETGAKKGHRIGPNLAGIIGRPAAAHKKYRYSQAMRTARKQGLIWSRDFLDAYLARPTRFLPEGTMAFIGLKSQDERDDLIAYLATFKAPDDAPWLLANLNKVDIPLPVPSPFNR